MLGNLCDQSEEIRSCVESADVVLASPSLLRKDNWRGQESVAKALKHLIRDADAATLNQLVDLLLENEPKSKSHVIMLLGYLLSVASHEDLVQERGAVNFSSRRVDFNGCSNSDTNGCKTCKSYMVIQTQTPIGCKTWKIRTGCSILHENHYHRSIFSLVHTKYFRGTKPLTIYSFDLAKKH